MDPWAVSTVTPLTAKEELLRGEGVPFLATGKVAPDAFAD